MKLQSFSVSETINAPIQEVFEALTKSSQLSAWSGKGKVEPKKGGVVHMFDGWVKGTVLEYDAPKKLKYTWKPEEWSDEWQPSVVSYDLEDLGEKTKLTIKHEKLPSEKEATDHKSGWFDYVINPLKDFVEKKN